MRSIVVMSSSNVCKDMTIFYYDDGQGKREVLLRRTSAPEEVVLPCPDGPPPSSARTLALPPFPLPLPLPPLPP